MSRTIFRLIFVLSLSFIVAIANAENISNIGKRHYRYGRVYLMGKGQRIYIFHNITKRSILINRYTRFNLGVDAGWASEIMPGRWSAILLKRPSFVLGCQSKNYRRYRKICCKHALTVRLVSRFKTKYPDASGYWIAENKTCRALKFQIRKRGFQLNDLPC